MVSITTILIMGVDVLYASCCDSMLGEITSYVDATKR